MLKGETSHLLTRARIAAATESRRLHYANRPKVEAPQVFVVRLAVDNRFGWEIRRFGNFVLSRSVETYGTAMLAETAGKTALADMPTEA